MNDNLLDEAVEFLDKSFENAAADQGSGCAETRQDDEAAVQDLFVQIAKIYARPVRSFVDELSEGTATKEWISICRPVLQSIMDAARKMDRNEAVRYMEMFDSTLAEAEKSSGNPFDGEVRWRLLACYAELRDAFSDVFQLGEQNQKREDIIIRSLLKQIPGVGRATSAKIYRAGLGSLSSLLIARPEDLAAAASIPLKLCERICERLQQYRVAIESMPRDTNHYACRACLAKLVRELRHQEKEIERTLAVTGSKPAVEAERQQRRQLRQRCNLQITVMLAELGELGLIQKLQKLSFKRRISRLENYLETALAIENGDCLRVGTSTVQS